MKAIRWLIFLAIGAAVGGFWLIAVPFAVVYPLLHLWKYIGAVWDAGFDITYAAILFEVRTEHMMPTVSICGPVPSGWPDPHSDRRI